MASHWRLNYSGIVVRPEIRGTLEYVFETHERHVPQTLAKEKALRSRLTS